MSVTTVELLPTPFIKVLQALKILHNSSGAFLTSLSPRTYEKEVKNTSGIEFKSVYFVSKGVGSIGMKDNEKELPCLM